MAQPALVGLARRRPIASLSRSRGIASHKKTAPSAITEKAAALYLPAHTKNQTNPPARTTNTHSQIGSSP
jgi:hypothetical protein